MPARHNDILGSFLYRVHLAGIQKCIMLSFAKVGPLRWGVGPGMQPAAISTNFCKHLQNAKGPEVRCIFFSYAVFMYQVSKST